MSSLAETQRLLWRAITAPEGAARLAAEEPQFGALLDRVVRGDERLDAVGRADIYGNMYFFRLLDVLREDFPAVVAAVGDVAFHNLVTDYLVAHPSRHYSLRWAGRPLPEFIATHSLGREFPWLADLARFEWTMGEAFDAADDECVTHERLQAIPPHDWECLRLRWHPAVRFLRTQWPVDELRDRFRKAKAQEERPSVTAEARYFCVWRSGFRVFYRKMESWEWEAATAIAGGATFGTACEHATSTLTVDEVARAIAGALARWVADGLIAEVSL